MSNPYFSDNLSERQIAVVMHYCKTLGATPDNMHYIKTEEYFSDLFPVDIAVFEPNELVENYVISTVGLSDYRFSKNFARCELMMVLPPEWKPIFDKEEYYWAPQLLKDIAYNIIERNEGVGVGQVYLLNNPEEKGTYCPFTDAVGAIVTLPEMFPFDVCEEKIGTTFTRFMLLVPITATDVSKIEQMGPFKFIEYELHDSEGPQMVVKLKEKQLQGIDRLIKHNEDMLKDKKSKTTKMSSSNTDEND